MRLRRILAAVSAIGLLSAGAVVLTTPLAGAAIPTTIDPTIADGAVNSLRDVLENQIAGGETVNLAAGATYTLDNCDAGDIDIEEPVTIEGNGATIEQTCDDRVLDAAEDLTINGATITGGRVYGSGGAILASDVALVLTGVRLVGNEAAGDGGAIDTDGDVTVIDSEISDNKAGGDGGAIDDSDGNVTFRFVRSTLAGNCSAESGGAISTEDEVVIELVNSTVTGNTAAADAAIDATDGLVAVTLVYTDVVDNTLDAQTDCGVTIEPDALAEDASERDADVDAALAADGANIQLAEDATLSTFGSVIARPNGAANCGNDETGTTTSEGYNYSDDDSCDLTDATDVENGTDPLLGALADNGGPTRTLAPQAGSPLVNAIPVAACGDGDTLAGTAVTTDQRGVARPQETGCEIGSVELEAPPAPEPVVIEPNFAG